MELQHYIAIVWKRWWLILLTTLLAAGAAALISFTATPRYRSTATLMVDSRSTPYEDAYRAAYNNEASAAAYARQITGPTVAEAVATRLGLSAPEELQALISVNHMPDTAMFEVSVQHPNPELAYTLADTLVQVFIEQATVQMTQRYHEALDELETQITALQAQITEDRIAWASYGESTTLTADARAEQARLQTQITNNQTRLTSLLSSTEQFRLAMARATGGLSVFQPARLPREPFSPQPLRNIALATVVGGMIGVGTAFLLDYLDDRVHAPEDVRQALGVTVLGALPYVAPDQSCGWLPQAQPLIPASEAFRDLRTSLQYVSLDAPLETILVTSTEPDEGKSFVAANLATAVALSGKRVLVLEADLRRSQVHHIWKMDRSPGLSDALRALSDVVGETDAPRAGAAAARKAVQSCIQPTLVDRLALMTAGAKVTTPSELLNSQTFLQLLDLLKTDFDLIILDSPPILAVTDAAVLTGIVDGVLVVVAAGKTRLPMAVRTLQRLEEIGGTLLGVVINQFTAQTGGYYYRYHQQDYVYGAPAPKPRRRAAARAEETAEAEQDWNWATHTVSRGTLTDEVSVSGKLVAVDEATLAFPVAGVVKAVHVAAGEHVTGGALIAELDAPELEDSISRAETQVTIAQLELAWAEGQRGTADQLGESERHTAGRDEVEVAVARERLKLAETLYARAQARLDALRLTAPFDGVVMAFDKQPGDAVAPYAAVGLLADTGRLRVEIEPPESVAGSLSAGTHANILLGGSQRRWVKGVVGAHSGTGAAPEARLVVDIVTDFDATAWLHQDVEVVLTTKTRRDVPWVPLCALPPSEGENYVNVQSNGLEDSDISATETKRVHVELGLVTDLRAEVLSGVEPGDTIVYTACR